MGRTEGTEGEVDDALADTYRQDGLSDLQIRQREDLRHAKTAEERIAVKVRYQRLAAGLIEQRQQEDGGGGGG